MKKIPEPARPARPATKINLFHKIINNFIGMIVLFFSPNAWRRCLLRLLESDNLAEQNKNLIDSGIIMINSTRDFGVEIEFVHSYDNSDSIYNDLRTQFPDWKIKSDSSIRPSGTEINSPILSGSAGLKEVEKMMDYLKGNKMIRVNDTCGLHVHVSAKDLTPIQILIASYRYGDGEEQFFDRIMNKNRNDNRYCATAKKNKITDCLNKRLYDIELIFKSFDHFRYNNHFDKYRKLNIYCYTHGTMEFRHHHATLNKAEILNWISFVTSFVDATKKNTENLVIDESFFKIEIPDTEVGKKYKALVELRKFTQEYPVGGLFFNEFVSMILQNRKIVHYDNDFHAMMENEFNKEFIRKIESFGFKISTSRVKDSYGDYYYNNISLKYEGEYVQNILDDSTIDEFEMAKKLLTNIEKLIVDWSKKIDLFDNVPNETIFYYSKLFDKQNKKIEKAKKLAINLLRERPEPF